MRCPDCLKFVGQEMGDPEGEPELTDHRTDENPDNEVFIEGDIRLPIVCAECGTELKEGTFTMQEQLEDDDLKNHRGEGHELSLSVDDTESTERTDGKPGTPSRYRKTYYGVYLSYTVTCECSNFSVSGDWSDDMQASSFDEL